MIKKLFAAVIFAAMLCAMSGNVLAEGFENEASIRIKSASPEVSDNILFDKNAGATGLGCLWGFRGKEELLAAGADLLAERPLDILECL